MKQYFETQKYAERNAAISELNAAGIPITNELVDGLLSGRYELAPTVDGGRALVDNRYATPADFE
jgi:hypothetical protein